MENTTRPAGDLPARSLGGLGAFLSAKAAEGEWVVLVGDNDFKGWQKQNDWQFVGAVKLDAKNPKRFTVEPGEGIIYNGPTGRTGNLISKEKFQDVEVHLEFNVPKGSNSGIKLEGLYEIQILDSFGLKTLKGKDCGGIYPARNSCRRITIWTTAKPRWSTPASRRRVADARHRLSGSAIRFEGQEDGKRAVRQGRPEWTSDSRECRIALSDRPRLAKRAGNSLRADFAPSRSRAFGVSKRQGQATERERRQVTRGRRRTSSKALSRSCGVIFRVKQDCFVLDVGNQFEYLSSLPLRRPTSRRRGGARTVEGAREENVSNAVDANECVLSSPCSRFSP